MNETTRQQLWQSLRDNGLVEGENAPVHTASSPWYVRVMLGVAGWIGACFLLGFVAIAFSFVIENAPASMLLGLLCCAGAWLIFRLARGNDFVTQFGVAFSFAGQALFIFGLFKSLDWNTPHAFFITGLFELMLAALVPNFLHRVLTSWAAIAALTFGLRGVGLHGLAPGMAAAAFALVWLNETRLAGKGDVWQPIGYGFALALVQVGATALWLHGGGWWRGIGEPGWLARNAVEIGAALVAVVFLATVLKLLAREPIGPASPAGMTLIAAAVLATVLSFFAQGITTALLILLLGFAAGNRILMGLGLLALGAFLSHYYYQLQATLLVKAMVLAISGLLLLTLRMLLRKWFPLHAEEAGHA